MQRRQSLWLLIGLMLILFLTFVSDPAERKILGGVWQIALKMVVVGTTLYFLMPLVARAKLFWKSLKFRWKFIVVSVLSVVYLAISFSDNHHKADPAGDDFVACFCLAVALFFLCLYGLMSRGLDALWFRITKRKQS